MTKSNIGKVFVGMVLMVGSAQASQWQFARASTLVPAGPDEAALGIKTLRLHSPVASRIASADATTTRVVILNMEQEVVGELVETKAAAVSNERGNAPEQTIELTFQGRRVGLHYKDRAIWISDGKSTATASFDRTNLEDAERVKAFADDLRLIAGIQTAAKSAIQQIATVRPTLRASVMGTLGIARIVPASWTAWFRGSGGGSAKDDGPMCYETPAHAKCAGGFGVSRTSACAYAEQETHNTCAAASGWCYGCCSWIGQCDCTCVYGDLACMCERCGGLCGPSGMDPAAK